MRLVATLTIALVAATLSAGVSKGQTSDLIGTWTAEATVIMQSDDGVVEVPNEFVLEIESVNGLVLRGSRTWRAGNNEPGYVGEETFVEATEPFIGALSQDGQTLRLGEVDDNGLMFATRHGDDMIELTYMEAAPHAIAYTAVFSRQE
jgi:hypothetical protein